MLGELASLRRLRVAGKLPPKRLQFQCWQPSRGSSNWRLQRSSLHHALGLAVGLAGGVLPQLSLVNLNRRELLGKVDDVAAWNHAE